MANYTTTKSAPLVKSAESNTFNITLTIAPKFGYVVSASDFSIDTDSLTNISISSKNDSSTAGTVSNTVLFTIAFQGYNMPSSDTVIGLAIVGDAVLANNNVDIPVSLSLDITNQLNEFGLSGTFTAATGYTANTAGGVTTVTGTASSDPDFNEEENDQYETIGTIVITPNAQIPDANNTTATLADQEEPIATVFTESVFPVLNQSNLTEPDKFVEPFIFTLTGSIENEVISDIKFGETISLTYDVAVNTTNPPVKDFDNVISIVSGSGKRPSAKIPVAINKHIKSMQISGSTVISPLGQTKNIKIYGDAGAVIDSVVLDRNGTNIVSITDDITLASTGTKSRGIGFASLDVVVGPRSGNYNSENSMAFTVTPKAGTTIPVTANVNRKLYQHPNPELTMNISNTSDLTWKVATVVGGTGITDFTSATLVKQLTGKPLAIPSDLSHVKGNQESFVLTYVVTANDGTAQIDLRQSNSLPLQPSFDSTASSDWTNSNYGGGVLGGGNGGTHLFMTNLSSKLYNSNHTEITSGWINGSYAVISAKVFILQWGIKDVTMTLDLNTLLTEIRD